MSAEIATFERVKHAADALRRRGTKPTAQAVIEMIGGGSKSTVLDHLKALRRQPIDEEELPQAVMEMMRPAVLQAYQAGQQSEAERFRAASERLSLTVEEMDEQIAETARELDRSEQDKTELGRRIEELLAVNSDLQRRLNELDVAKAHLQVQLDEERTRFADGLKDALERMEKAVDKTGTGGSERRPTLTLAQRRRKGD